jgi:hypothetical protein
LEEDKKGEIKAGKEAMEPGGRTHSIKHNFSAKKKDQAKGDPSFYGWMCISKRFLSCFF